MYYLFGKIANNHKFLELEEQYRWDLKKWISKYLNSKFGTNPGRISNLLGVFWKRTEVLVGEQWRKHGTNEFKHYSRKPLLSRDRGVVRIDAFIIDHYFLTFYFQ